MSLAKALQVALIDDNDADREMMHQLLQGAQAMQFAVTEFKQLKILITTLDEQQPQAILIAENLLTSVNQHELTALRQRLPAVPIIMMTTITAVPMPFTNHNTIVDDYLIKGYVDEKQLIRLLYMQIQYKRLKQEIETLSNQQLSVQDEITQLPNHLLFQDRLQQAIGYAYRLQQQIAVMIIDINQCQLLSEEIGHAAVNQIRLEAARRLQCTVHMPDTVAHYAEDKFAIILTNIPNVVQAAKVAQIVQRVIAEPYDIAGSPIFITASVGMAVYPEDGDDRPSIMASCQAALANAKQQGKESFKIFSQSMQDAIEDKLILEKDMRIAWAQGQFIVTYQPIFECQSRNLVSMQAQMRWQHPIRGLLPSQEFVTLAEETGLLFPLTDWLLRAIARQLRMWQDEGFTIVPIAISLTHSQFMRENLIENLQQILVQATLNPKYLVFEMNESNIIAHGKIYQTILANLHKLGVGLSIAEFSGKGSILQLIKQLPVQHIKLSGLQALELQCQNEAYVKSLVELIKSIHKTVMFTDVSDSKQVQLLQTFGCHTMQGHYVGDEVRYDAALKVLVENEVSMLENIERAPSLRA